MNQHYDVAVVGGQVSGLVAAALLAKRGRRVVLLDHGENTTSYRRRGLRLPLVPTLIPLLESSPPVQKVHHELGIGPDLRACANPLDPIFQAIMPKNRIDVRADRRDLLTELTLEFPHLGPALDRFFERLFGLDQQITDFLSDLPTLPPAGWAQAFRTRKRLAEIPHLDAPFEESQLFAGIPENHPVREMLLGPLSFFGHLDARAPSTFHAVRLIARFFRGALGFSDRLGGHFELLLSAARRAGVDIRLGAVVKRAELVGRRVRHLEVSDAHHDVTADFVVANTLTGFQELLPPHRLQARYALARKAVCPNKSLLVINLVVEKQVIPMGLAETAFLLNGRRIQRDTDNVDPPLLLCRYAAEVGQPPEKPSELARADQEVLSTACPVNTTEVSRSPERLAALKKQILARLGRLIPFLGDFVVDTSLPVDTGSWDLESDKAVRLVDPWHLHPIYEPAERPLLGIASRPVRTVFKNLVHCGHDVVPGLGLEGDYYAGLMAANTLGDMAGRRWKR